MSSQIVIIGGGLAGTSAAWKAAELGVPVCLYEMRPRRSTEAHTTADLAELVCSNSLGSMLPSRASGILMAELRQLGSMLLDVADVNGVPAGGALAVDRGLFASQVTRRIEENEHIRLVRKEVKTIPRTGLVIVASGPLTSPSLAKHLKKLTGREQLYFFDALAPIIETESIDRNIAFHGSRYERGQKPEGDYLNCPFTKEEYYAFVEALLSAERISLRSFELEVAKGVRAGPHVFFEGCLPVEIIAERGVDSLAFGPMRPVGLIDPRSGRRPYAVVQLRQDDLLAQMYNMVGFQTNLAYQEQKRVFRMIPGLAGARFVRFGEMHRNTFINAPKLLRPTLQSKDRKDLFFAGQLTGVEGYLGNIGTGLLAGLNAGRMALGQEPLELPTTTMLGSLCRYVTEAESDHFQPMKANLGILPRLEDGVKRKRRERAQAHADRSGADLRAFLTGIVS